MTYYFLKSDPSQWQVYPVPANLDDFYVVESGSDVNGMRYDPNTDTLVALDLQPVRRITVLAFRRRFTAAEKVAIYQLADTDYAVRIWLDDLAAAEYINLDDQEINNGFIYLVNSSVLAADRQSEVFADPNDTELPSGAY